ncbi:MAG: hypothetical protein V3S89_03255 [Desulfobacterales bacterium]
MADAKDPRHRKSIESRDVWLEKGGVLVTSNYILDESLTLIRMRLGMEAAEKWWDMVAESPRCSIEWVTPERMEKSISWFLRWQDQSFSFTDCTSFVLMRELGIKDALTGERHFTTAGFQIHPQ